MVEEFKKEIVPPDLMDDKKFKNNLARSVANLWEHGESLPMQHPDRMQVYEFPTLTAIKEIESKRRKSKALIASAKFVNKQGGKTSMPVGAKRDYTTLVIYPMPEHAEIFASTHRGLRGGSPGKFFPGSLGSMHYKEKAPGNFEIKWWEGSYTQANMSAEEKKVARQYGNWLHKLCGELLEKAASQKLRQITVTTDSTIIRVRENPELHRTRVPNQLIGKFMETAAKIGCKYIKQEKGNEETQYNKTIITAVLPKQAP